MDQKIKMLKMLSYVQPTLAAHKALELFATPKRHTRPEIETKWIASATQKQLPNGLYVYEWGDVSKPLVLLAHGWEGRGSQMGAFAEPLLASGYSVVAVDGPAHGESGGHHLNAGIYSRALVETAKFLDRPVHAAVGHSFGAGCLVLAGNLGLKYDKLVHIAGPSDYMKVIRNFLNYVPLSSYSEKKFFDILMKEANLSFDQIHVGKMGTNLNSPTLIIHDSRDKEVRIENAHELHRMWPHSQLEVTEGHGHRRILKDPEVISKAIEFLKANK